MADLPDPAVDGPRLARAVLMQALRVRRNENVTIEAWTSDLPWVDAFVVETRRLGARPMVLYESEPAYFQSAESVPLKNLGHVGAQEWAALHSSDAYVYFYGPADRIRYHRLSDNQRGAIERYETDWFRASRETGLRWCRLDLGRASPGAARDFGVDLAGWRRELIEASTIDPRSMVRSGRKIARRLRSGRKLTISHPNGTQLELRLVGHEPYVDDGVVDEEDVRMGRGEMNVPSGVVIVALDERVAEGVFVSNRPSRYGAGLGAGIGGRWTFRSGRLIEHSYAEGRQAFRSLYDKAGPTRDRPGIVSIGLNPKIRDAPLLEDQELGVVALYVGDNRHVGGRSGGNFRSWLLIRGADLAIDGRPLLRSGQIR